MTKPYRHRRTANPANAFPTPLEPGEIAVNTANRQIAIGDANAATIGIPLPVPSVQSAALNAPGGTAVLAL